MKDGYDDADADADAGSSSDNIVAGYIEPMHKKLEGTKEEEENVAVAVVVDIPNNVALELQSSDAKRQSKKDHKASQQKKEEEALLHSVIPKKFRGTHRIGMEESSEESAAASLDENQFISAAIVEDTDNWDDVMILTSPPLPTNTNVVESDTVGNETKTNDPTTIKEEPETASSNDVIDTLEQEQHQQSYDSDDSDLDNDDDTLSHWSSTPPNSMPILLVDAQRLIGYIPTTETERKNVQDTIHHALFNSSSSSSSKKQQEKDDEEYDIARFFNTRTMELFQMGMIRHCDTVQYPLLVQQYSDVDFENIFIPVPYPEYVYDDTKQQQNRKQNNSDIVVHCTADIWKRFEKITSSSNTKGDMPEIVRRLLTHVQNCCRTMIWKHTMWNEILGLVEHTKSYTHRSAYKQRRTYNLQQLYEIHKVLQQRITSVQEELQEFETTRQKKIALVQQQHQQNNVSTANTDHAAIFGLGDDDDDSDYPLLHNEDDTEPDYDDYGSDDDDKHDSDEETTTTSKGTNDEEQEKAKLRKAQQQEYSKVEEECTTKEHKKLIVIVQSLQSKLGAIDELLESIQNDEWVDQEEADECTKESTYNAEASSLQTKAPSVLERIVSTVLGSMPPPLQQLECDPSILMKRHVEFLENEHATILNEWEIEFGMLPPSLPSPLGHFDSDTNKIAASSINVTLNDGSTENNTNRNMVCANVDATTTAVQRRKDFGIDEPNEDFTWENDDEDVTKSTSPPIIGLRPGGTVV